METILTVLKMADVDRSRSAAHPKHGLAWTDGKSVFLVPISIIDEEVVKEPSTKLGQFEFVESLHWSQNHNDPLCYLCVVHQTHVTIWKTEGPSENLDFKQVRKINATPIPQGCLWNPERDVLCILNKDQCSFYFRHCQNKGSFSLPPIESGKLGCGSWSADGKKLVVAIGAIILIYQWKDIDKSISDYAITAWKVPDIDGNIRGLESMYDTRMVCTAEIPLEKLCTTKQDMFEARVLDDTLSESDLDEDYELIKPGMSGHGNHTHSLMNLPRTEQVVTQQHSLMIVFEIQNHMIEPQKIASEHIDGILTPDLLYAKGDSVIVGSSNTSILYTYSWLDGSLSILPMELGKDERPKGICGVPWTIPVPRPGVLAMIGCTSPADSAFPNTSPHITFNISLRFLPTASASDVSQATAKMGLLQSLKGMQVQSGNSKVHLLRISPLRSEHSDNSGKKIAGSDQQESSHVVSQSSDDESDIFSSNHSPQFDLVLPGHTNASDPKRPLMEILESSNSLYSSEIGDKEKTSTLKNKFKHFLEPARKETESTSAKAHRKPPKIPQRPSLKKNIDSCSSRDASPETPDLGAGDCSYLHLQSLILAQDVKIDAMNKRLDEIAKRLPQCSPSPSIATCEKIQIVYHCPHTASEVKRTFLLDNRRLQLDAVKHTFGLIAVEVLIDGEPCSVGSRDGYIPLQFEPDSVIHITGKRYDESEI